MIMEHTDIKDYLIRLDSKMDSVRNEMSSGFLTVSKEIAKMEVRVDTTEKDINELYETHRLCVEKREKNRKEDQEIFDNVKSIQTTYKFLVGSCALVVSVATIFKIFGVL